jgi:hypothetical protein
MLELYVSDSKPELQSQDLHDKIYASEEASINGKSINMNIIGYSHYISSPELNYYELMSCMPVLQGEDTEIISLQKESKREEQFKLNTISGQISIEVTRGILEFKSPDIQYAFDTDAYTEIKYTQDGYKTLHSYPEKNITVLSVTTFKFNRDKFQN